VTTQFPSTFATNFHFTNRISMYNDNMFSCVPHICQLKEITASMYLNMVSKLHI